MFAKFEASRSAEKRTRTSRQASRLRLEGGECGGGASHPRDTPLFTLERSYAVILEPEAEGGYSVHIPAFRGAHTQGETVEECLANAREVIELHAEVMLERGEQLPAGDVAASVTVRLPPAA
jgi:antitoxin HicB